MIWNPITTLEATFLLQRIENEHKGSTIKKKSVHRFENRKQFQQKQDKLMVNENRKEKCSECADTNSVPGYIDSYARGHNSLGNNDSAAQARSNEQALAITRIDHNKKLQ